MTDSPDRRGRRRVTLNDVAERAGVSRALVSIVMREAPGASDATRTRVLAAAQELGYRPDARARSLAGRASNLIGVMFGVGVGAFHFDLLEGLYAAAEEHGYNLILSPVTRGRDEAKAAESLQDFRFDGLIMLGPADAGAAAGRSAAGGRGGLARRSPPGRRGPHLRRDRAWRPRWITWWGWGIVGSPTSTAGRP